MQITRTDSLADSGKILKESIIRELYEDAERQLKETLSAHQRELFEKLALLKMLGWRILQGFQSLFHFLKKRCFHRLLREYPTDSLL